ncbi:MAG: prepilin-type N-terminal cleavage/methylation domain-containing protein [Planctomycetes bacterium]|nr:prepilin-type N-terminal cleavage/methylation domain-containing protein [Planctomycetota bacterium]
MTRRPGITLVEVLVAILITGVGLLALLVLFPLGALEMAQAVKDDRAGHVKHNAAAFASIVWPNGGPTGLRTDPDVQNGMLNPNGANPSPYPGGAPLDPYGGGTAPVSYYLPGGTINPSMSSMSSYPVIVDPNGYWANKTAAVTNPTAPFWQDWVAGGPANPNVVLPRRVYCEPLKPTSPDMGSQMTRRWQLLRWTTLLDDLTFPRDVDYAGRAGTGAQVYRTVRYSWAYLCRMPKAITNGPVHMTVIVYSGRALEQATSGETAFSANFGVKTDGTSDPNVVSISWNAGQDPPDLSVGGWILDATMVVQPNRTPAEPGGYFYRVVSVNQTGVTSMDVEVQTPVLATGPGPVVIMDGVIEVFDLRTL